MKSEILKAPLQIGPLRRKVGKHLRKPLWLYIGKLRIKRGVYKWKEDQLTKEQTTSIAHTCRDDVKKAKAQNDLRLANNAKNNKKGLFSLCPKEEVKEVVRLLHVQMCNGKR